MTMRRLICAVLLLFATLPAAAQDAVGKWKASIEGPQGAFVMMFQFDVDGDKLSGAMSNEFMGSTPITDGTIDGNNLAFKLTFQGPNGSMTVNYTAVVNGDEMTLTSKFANPPPGAPAENSFTATREKD